MTKNTDDQPPDELTPEDSAPEDSPSDNVDSPDSSAEDSVPGDEPREEAAPAEVTASVDPAPEEPPSGEKSEDAPAPKSRRPVGPPPEDPPRDDLPASRPPPPRRGDRRLAAILFADVAGYTALSSHDEDLALSLIRSFQRLSRKTVTDKGGRVVKFLGDGMLAEFSSLDSAVNAAHALQGAFPDLEEVAESNVSLRVGVHLGDIVFGEDGDVYGSGVNVASRIESHAPLSGVVVSDSAYQHLRHRRQYAFSSIGQKDLKGVPDPMELYVVLLAGQEPPAPALLVQANGAAPAKPRKKRSKMRWMAAAFALAAGVTAVALDLGGIQAQFDNLLESAGLSPVFTRVVYAELPLEYHTVEGGAAVDSDITVRFSGRIDVATATRFNIRLLDPENESVLTEVRASEDASAVVVDPVTDLEYSTRYRIDLTASLLSTSGEAIRPPRGATPAGGSLFFTTQNIPPDPPEVSSTDPANGSTGAAAAGPVLVTFSKPMNPETFDSTTVALTTRSGARVAVQLTCCGESRNALRVDPVEPMAAGLYTVVLAEGIRDALGLPLEPDTFGFRVGQVARPITPRGPGRLTVQVIPESVAPRTIVFIDGEAVGPAPVQDREVSEGESHRIEIYGTSPISRETIRIYSAERTLSPAEELTVSAEVTPFGTVNIASVPGGTVFIDGREIGTTPLVSYPVTAGEVHTLEIRPLAANAATHGPYTVEFSVALLEDKALGRVELPTR